MSINYPRIILAGTHSGAGKTTIGLGITLLLEKMGFKVQNFKAGPDYIDGSYYKSCRNLDSWLFSRDVLLELFKRQAKKADISIIEGVMGLYDGLGNTEKGSTAQLSKILKSPVILVVDARGMSRSAGAAALGYKNFDRKVNTAGVILNNIGSQNHYNLIKSSIKVLGYLPKSKDLRLPERHLGLVPTREKRVNGAFCNKLLDIVEKNIDIEGILKISREAGPLPFHKETIFNLKKPINDSVRIAVAKDKAFNFYYQDNLDILKHLGAEIVEFSPLSSSGLPDSIHGIYIGGGFPELFAEKLSRNISLKKHIVNLAKSGLPVYAECGGLMYLMREIEGYPMAGIFPGRVRMGNRLQPFGYVEIKTAEDNILSRRGDRNRAHMFHWSYIDGISNKDHTFVKGNVLASYCHLHFGSNINLAKRFIKSCYEYKKGK